MFSFQERRKRHRIKRSLYTLFRQGSVKIDYYTVTQGSVDFDTGEQTITTTVSNLSALMYTSTLIKKFENDIAYLAANKNFTYGGEFLINNRLIIIMDPGFFPQTDHYVIAGDKRFNVERVQEIEPRAGFILFVRQTDGQKMRQEVSIKPHQYLEINQDVSFTKS